MTNQNCTTHEHILSHPCSGSVQFQPGTLKCPSSFYSQKPARPTPKAIQNLSSEYATINAVASSFSQIRALGEEVAGRNLTDLRQYRRCRVQSNYLLPSTVSSQHFLLPSCQPTASSTSLKSWFLSSFIFCSSKQDETNDNMALAPNCHYHISRSICVLELSPACHPSYPWNTVSRDCLSCVCSTCFLLNPYSHVSPLNPQQ